MDAQIVGGRIAKLRKSHNMTQKQLADELSVTYKAVSKWETGAGLPDIAMLPALASVFNVSVDEIVSDSPNNENKEDSNSNKDNRIRTLRRYIRKPAVIMSSFIILLVAFVITQGIQKSNEIKDYDDGLTVHSYEASGFGISADYAKSIYDAQLAHDLRTQLLQISHIEKVLVLVRTAEASPFRIQENELEAMVSVLLTITDTYTLSDIDIHTIQDLILKSVPNIKEQNIAITDNNHNYYQSTAGID